MTAYDHQRAQMEHAAEKTLGIGLSTGNGPSAIANDRYTIRQALDEQMRQIGALHGLITELGGRLESLLEVLPPEPTAGSGVSPEPSQILDRIAMANSGIDAACARLDRLTRRLQV